MDFYNECIDPIREDKFVYYKIDDKLKDTFKLKNINKLKDNKIIFYNIIDKIKEIKDSKDIIYDYIVIKGGSFI